MRHSLTAQGFGVRLRPVAMADAPFIVWLRNLDFVKGRVGDSVATVASQEDWLKRYFEREGDYYFIVETLRGIPLGTYSIYNMKGSSAEIGRLVMRHGVTASMPASILLFDLFYGKMGLTQLYAFAVEDNYGVHSLMRKYEFFEAKEQHAVQVIGGRAIRLLRFVQSVEDWPRARAKGLPKVERVEPRILKWEQEHLELIRNEGMATRAS